jgi:predicted phage baseplate assembly protein
VTINANVAPANHGETVSEVLGAGDGSRTYQTFALKQTPLTYVSASNPTGALSTLEVRVNDILWHEVPTLYGRGPDERIYVTRRTDEGITVVQFGDGVTGARLPTGQDNVRAVYRKGIGRGGLVDEERLTQLMSRPLGLKEVTNPRPATGGEDPESRDQARQNVPLTVLTLGRTVSLQDYEDFTRAFAGVAKAHAAWIHEPEGPTVFLTVAGVGGAEIAEDSQTYEDLLDALAQAGDPHARFRVVTYRPATFRLAAKVRLDPDFLAEKVLPAVEGALRQAFAFDARRFGQPVTLAEVMAVVHGVAGVVAVDVDALYRGTVESVEARLLAELPHVTAAGETVAAELLTLDPAPLDRLEVLP